MPEDPFAKAWPHPSRQSDEQRARGRARRAGVGGGSESGGDSGGGGGYVELAATSNYSFLRGASHPDELVRRAGDLGQDAVAIADRNTLAGIVRAHVAAKDCGVRLIVGCRLVFDDPRALSVLVYPTDRAAYGRLCRLLTLGKRRAEKGECLLTLSDLIDHHEGLLAVALPPAVTDERFIAALDALRDTFDDDRLSIAARRAYAQDDEARQRNLAALASSARIPMVAVNAPLYHDPSRRPLQDVLTCVRHGCTIAHAGLRLNANAERHLKPADEMARLFARHPGAISRTLEIADRCAGFSLDQLRYEYPDEIAPSGVSPMAHLVALTSVGAAKRYPRGVPPSVRMQIEHELRLIDELNYAPYFLTVHGLVEFANSKGILCQGRGAAANSAVCYCLGVTAVDPDRVSMLFERFLSRERDEPPDIDIDFEHERREEVIQHIYATYGRERAALTAEVISYRGRSAIRDVGKAMGLSLDLVDRLAKDMEWWTDSPGTTPDRADRVRAMGLDPAEPTLARTMALASELMGFPRHLSQHVGGFVITRSPLCELVPIENARMEDRTVIEWDKDDIDALGMLKVDVLGLGMLTCLRKTLDLVREHEGHNLTLATIPAEDPATYDMICAADTIGVFQIESRAQMSMLPRLKPRCYYDLVIEVAIVRPGPIQGNMVHPYLRRRSGEEPAIYFDERVRRVLERTLGVPLFQEQAMALAVEAAGFTPGEADQLRRAIAAWKTRGNKIAQFGERIIDGMLARGYPRGFAEQCFEQIKGFSGYGFPESHAASFALLVYASSWLKRHHPAAFAAALLNSQPMGFYQPAQIVRDAREHGVEVRPVDVNASAWDCTLEPSASGQGGVDAPAGDATRDPPDGVASGGPAIRLGMCLVRGVGEAEANAIVTAVRRTGPYHSVERLWRASAVRVATLRRLAKGDAFASMGLTRQRALWAIQPLRDTPLPLFDALFPEPAALDREPGAPQHRREREADAALPPQSPESEVIADYHGVGLSLRAHPVSFLRERLDALRVRPNASLSDANATPAGRTVRVAGVALVRQRPGTASGIVFITLEDETGVANLIVRPTVYDRFRRAARHAKVLLCEGKVERQGAVVHVLARSLWSLDQLAPALATASRDFH